LDNFLRNDDSLHSPIFLLYSNILYIDSDPTNGLIYIFCLDAMSGVFSLKVNFDENISLLNFFNSSLV